MNRIITFAVTSEQDAAIKRLRDYYSFNLAVVTKWILSFATVPELADKPDDGGHVGQLNYRVSSRYGNLIESWAEKIDIEPSEFCRRLLLFYAARVPENSKRSSMHQIAGINVTTEQYEIICRLIDLYEMSAGSFVSGKMLLASKLPSFTEMALVDGTARKLKGETMVMPLPFALKPICVRVMDKYCEKLFLQRSNFIRGLLLASAIQCGLPAPSYYKNRVEFK